MKPEEAIEELNHELLILECLIEEVNSFICDCDVDDDEYDDEKEQYEISLTRYKKEKEVIEMAISAIKELQQYHEIGTVEECRKAVKEEDALKFYYCESEDDYYIGKRVGNFYYARYGETGFEWFMSRYLPWGEHVIAPNTLWKEHIYPSEPKEIPFFEWLQGFIKRYCGGTVEECREAVEKQKPKKPHRNYKKFSGLWCKCGWYLGQKQCLDIKYCPNCDMAIGTMGDKREHHFCLNCGQRLMWEE